MGEPFAEFFRQRLGALDGGASRFRWSTMALSRAQRCLRFGTEMAIEVRDQFRGVIRGDAQAVSGPRALLEVDGSGEIRVRGT
jgi:hypothetical protein